MDFGFGNNAKASRMMESPAPMEAASEMESMMEESKSSSDSEDSSRPDQTERKRIYNGSAGLIVEKLDDTRTALENKAVETGGYVESSYRDYVVLRVPSEHFQEMFAEILTLGKISFQEINTWDVTDQFSDTKQRLETAEKTRERLYALLEKSQDAEERALILREIGRLSEEIESIKQQLLLMENRIAFSRITVTLIPKLEDDSVSRYIPFDWIAFLDPISPASQRLKAKITLNPGDDFAVFSKEKIYLAEDAEGTTLFVSTLENKPRGDSQFWQKALVFHLADYYESSETFSLQFGDKEFQAVRFVSKDRDPFQYILGVRADGKDLHVLEIFSPRAGKDLSPLVQALEQGEFK